MNHRKTHHLPTHVADAAVSACTLKVAHRTDRKPATMSEITNMATDALIAALCGVSRTSRALKRALGDDPIQHMQVRDAQTLYDSLTHKLDPEDESGRKVVSRFAAALELARRAHGAGGVTMSRPEDVVPYLSDIRHEQREHFVGFYMNARHQLIERRVISIGSLSASIVHPREVFRPGVELAAAGLIVSHNHPSGDPEPSPEDIAVTRRLREAGDLVGIELLDHIVIAAKGHVSLKSRGAV